MMKIGDLVMFINAESTYAKWFFGQLAEVQTCNYSNNGKLHCRVKWINPVQNFDRFTTISDFAASNFKICKDEQIIQG